MKHDLNEGVLYIATGKRHIDLAIKSAVSVRKTNPDFKIHLFGDWEKHNFNFDSNPYPFTSVGNILNPHRRSKIDFLHKTPFQRTLFLDNDTRVVVELSALFNLLDRFDVALAHAHRRELKDKQKNIMVNVPISFPQFNSGVFLYKKNEKTLEAFAKWKEWFYESKLMTDQNTLKEVMWDSDLRIATLPPEYNVRFIKFLLIWSKYEARPKIFHMAYFKEGPFAYVKKFQRKIKRRTKRLFYKIVKTVKNE